LQTLRQVALVAAEDTRHSRKLLSHFDIQTPLVSYHQHNQRERRTRLLRALETGDVALITDAGTPAVSDPGADLVAAALSGGHRVSPVPGPSALTAAASVSGLIDGPFVSLGFLPREQRPRSRTIARAAASGWPLVLFESPLRLPETLRDLETALGDRPVVMLRELSKVHEEVRPASLRALRDWAEEQPLRGEVVLVIAGADDTAAGELDAIEVVRMLRRSGMSPSQAAREAATITGLPRAELYRLAREGDAEASAGLEGELSLPNEDAL
jgi:16S rRNA (cytidine1402-2'-O)-methyltransferase